MKKSQTFMSEVFIQGPNCPQHSGNKYGYPWL